MPIYITTNIAHNGLRELYVVKPGWMDERIITPLTVTTTCEHLRYIQIFCLSDLHLTEPQLAQPLESRAYCGSPNLFEGWHIKLKLC